MLATTLAAFLLLFMGIFRLGRAVRLVPHSVVTGFTAGIAVVIGLLQLRDLLGIRTDAAPVELIPRLVAWRMGDFPHVARMIRDAPRGDAAVMLACMLLTVAFDMIVSVTVGLAMASLIFIRRMSEASTVTLVSPQEAAAPATPLPSGVVLYRVGGPLFFGAAAKAMRELERIERMRLVILDLGGVPFIDSTGLVNLESTVSTLAGSGTAVAIVGLEPGPAEVLERAMPHWQERPRIFRRVEDVLASPGS